MSDKEEHAKTRILIVEDEALFAKAVKKRLEVAGYHPEVAGSLAIAHGSVDKFNPDLVVLDMRLPDGSGLDFLAELREKNTEVPVLVLSAYGDLEDAVAAMKLQASDYLKKPIDLDELLLNIEKVLDREQISRQLEYSRKRESVSTERVNLLGECEPITQMRAQAQHIGQLVKDPDIIPPNILILGETGTGKDMAARYLHSISARKDRPFVHVDCAALPKDLIEAELFGHEKGAFTNAVEARTGLLEAAEEGVVFLDEIGELPLELQAKLLAVLERRSLRRVGSSQERPMPAWVISATNRDPESMVEEGEMRSDLYFRLNVLCMKMPPLRERGKDILILAEHFCQQTATRYGLKAITLTDEAKKALMAYPWPGNIREMKHLIERAVLLCVDGVLTEQALMLNTSNRSSSDVDLQGLESMTLDQAEQYMLEAALRRTSNNVSEAARQLGITRMAMRYRMQKYNLS